MVALASYSRWLANERAMRLGESLPTSPLPRLLAVSIGVIALLAGVLAILDALVG